jgi:hypothetical protein
MDKFIDHKTELQTLSQLLPTRKNQSAVFTPAARQEAAAINAQLVNLPQLHGDLRADLDKV